MNTLPRLNSWVYIVTYVDGIPYCVTRDIVFMRNKDSFIVEDALSNSVIDEYRTYHTLDGYGESWVKTFKEVKEVLAKSAKEESKYRDDHIVKYVARKSCENSWNVEEV